MMYILKQLLNLHITFVHFIYFYKLTKEVSIRRGKKKGRVMSAELKLMHQMIKKLMETFSEINEMYNRFQGKESSEVKPSKPSKFVSPLEVMIEDTKAKLNGLRTSPLDNLVNNKKDLQPQVPTRQAPKELFSYKQRIAALRNIGKHVEKESIPAETKRKRDSTKHTAFFIYLREKKNKLQIQYPEISPSELVKILSDDWKNMSQEQKRPFYRQTADNRKQFDGKFQKYFDSIVKRQEQQEQPAQEDS